MRNNPNSNDQWFFIKTKDGTRRGYMPANSKEEACKKFGVLAEECSVRSVIWNGEEFVEADQSKQGRLFSLS